MIGLGSLPTSLSVKIFLRYQIETQLTPTCYGVEYFVWSKVAKPSPSSSRSRWTDSERRCWTLPCETRRNWNQQNSLTMFTALQWTRYSAISQEVEIKELISKKSNWDAPATFHLSFSSSNQSTLKKILIAKVSAQADWEISSIVLML